MKVNRKFLRSAERLSLSAIAKDSAAQKIVSAVTAIGFGNAACSCIGEHDYKGG